MSESVSECVYGEGDGGKKGEMIERGGRMKGGREEHKEEERSTGRGGERGKRKEARGRKRMRSTHSISSHKSPQTSPNS